MVRLRADLHRLGEAGGAGREDHELLERELVARVRAAVDYVEAGDREHVRRLDARELGEVLVDRHALLGRARVRDGDGDAEDRVRAELALVRGAVELEQEVVDRLLVRHGQAGLDELRRDHLVHVLDRLRHA
jgi:hypothetical protein